MQKHRTTLSLEIGEFQQTYFEWTIPVPRWYWQEYDIDVVLKDGGGDVLDTYPNEDAFLVTPLSQQEIEELQGDHAECWYGAQSECELLLATTIPFAGTLPHALLFVEKMCEAGELDWSGRPGESKAAFISGLVDFAWVGLGIVGVGSGLEKPLYWADVLGTGASLAKECMEMELVGLIGPGGDRSVPEGALVDSLASWFFVGIDSVAAELADVLLVEGECVLRVEADSSYADEDSVGIRFALLSTVGDRGATATVHRGAHRFTSPEGANPHSDARLIARSQANQVLNVGLLHRTEADTLAFVRYPEFGVTDSTFFTVIVSDSIAVPVLEVDLDGDGTVDFLWYPGVAGVEEQMPNAQPAAHVLSLASAPNPTTGSTALLLRNAARLADVSVSVYDVSGREVRRLPVGDLAAGAHQVVWDGNTHDGRRVASGIYYCVATYAGEGATTHRLLVLR